MARNAIESDFRSSKMAQKGLPKWRSEAILKKKLTKKIAYLSEMASMHSKVIFGHPKMAAGSHFVKKINKITVAY